MPRIKRKTKRPKGRTVRVKPHCRNTHKGKSRLPKFLRQPKMPF